MRTQMGPNYANMFIAWLCGKTNLPTHYTGPLLEYFDTNIDHCLGTSRSRVQLEEFYRYC